MTPSPLDRGTKLCLTVCRGCNLKEIVDFKGGENVSQQYQDGFGKKKMWKRVKAKAGWKKMEVEEGRLAQTSRW